MKPSDVKPYMMFSAVDITSYIFTVEEVVGDVAKGISWGCFGPSQPAEAEIKHLVDPKVFRYLEHDTFERMQFTIQSLKDQVARLEKEKQKAEELRAATLAHHEPNTMALCAGDRRADILQQKLDDFRKQTREDFLARKTDLKRVWLYVDNMATGEYGYRDSEGHLCAQLLEKWGGGNASDPSQVPVQDFNVKVAMDEKDPSLMHISANIPISWRWFDNEEPRRLVNSTANAVARGDLKLDSNGNLIAMKDMTIGGLEEVDERSKHTALGEITAVLWFLTTLALDHEPLCAIKQGGDAKCDCDKLIPDDDTWAKRVRAALQLPGKIHQELKEVRDQAAHASEAHSLEQKARLQAVAVAMEHAKRLREFETKLTSLVAHTPYHANDPDDAVVAYVADLKKVIAEQDEKLKTRRVLQAKPIAGTSAGGIGTVYEFPLDGEQRILVVVKAPVRYLPSGRYAEWASGIHALIKKEFGPSVKGVVMDNGMELTLLELP